MNRVTISVRAAAAGVVLLLLAVARGGEVRRDVVYGRADGVELLLDAARPAAPGRHPVAILVHGGGWTAGDKSGSDKPGNSADISPWFHLLDSAGFTWFSINYRLAPAHPWPTCIEDLDTAIRWVKAHAGEFGGDPSRIVLFGHSAGGQMVCYAAVHADPSTAVQAVVAFAPVTDLVADSERRGGLSPSLQSLFHRPRQLDASVRPVLEAASPVAAVHGGEPPMLIVQGTADSTVPPSMSRAFVARLRAAGDRADYLPVENGPHRFVDWARLDPNYEAAVSAWLRAQGFVTLTTK